MAERKAVNKYYPPDWDPRKGSVNKRVGQHPLRDRARKLSQGILVIRFELPYNIWCGGCGNHIGMGVRYNAEKSKVGNYYTTPIYKFRMKCHLCDNYFEIQTDPKNHDYVILSGAQRKEQRWDPVANEQVVPEDKATQKKLATDPMYKLEHGSDDLQKGKEKVMSLTEIEESRMSMQDDYILNRMARDKFRAEKKQLKEAADADRAILEKASLNIDLVEETEEDRKLAGLMKYSVTASFEDRQRERRKNIEQRPLFSVTVENSLSPKSSSSSASPYTSPNQQHVPAALGQHGDLKHKLLHTSYKDPFRCVRKPNRKASSSSILPGHSRLGIMLKEHSSRLGIKLKSSRDVTFVTPKVVQERKMDKTDDFMKSHPTVAIPEATDVHSGSQDIGDTPRAIISDASSSDVALVHEGKDHTESTDFAFQPSGTTDAPENVLASPELSSSLSSASENESGSKQLKGSLIAMDSQEEQDCSDDKVKQTDSHEQGSARKSHVDKKTPGEVGFSNTGLQTLMCSYTDSDSELSS